MPTRPRAQRPRLTETAAHMAWNGGKTGKPRPPEISPAVEACRVDACGTPADGPHPGPGMTQVAGAQDGAASHWYCDGRCAAIARARADLRSDGHRQVNP